MPQLEDHSRRWPVLASAGGDLATELQDSLFAEILELSSGEERSRFFSLRSGFDVPELIGLLCDRANRLVRSDIDSAETLIATTGWLAESSGGATATGRHLRASGNLLAAKRDYRGAVVKYESALAVLEQADNKREIVRTLSTGLGILTLLGRHEQSATWAESAHSACKALGDPLLRARLEFNIGHSFAHRDRYREALERYQSAYRYFLVGGEHTDVAMALRNIAVTHQQLADFSAALVAYEAAATFCREHDLAPLLLEVEYNAAYIHFLRGDSEQSIRLFDKAREQLIKVGDWHHAALCDLDESEIFLELNLIEEAKAMGARAFEQFEELGMPYEAAQALTLQGIAANRAGLRTDSLELLEQARERFAAKANLFRLGEVDIFRAQVLYEQGRHRHATELVTSAHQTFSRIGLPTKIALCQLLLARLALAQLDTERARKWCDSTLEAVEGIGVPVIEYQAHLIKGLAIESAGDSEAALACYQMAHATLEQLRSHLHADELKIAFSGDQQSVYESLITLLLSEESPGNAPIVFDYIQKAKSRSLSDLLATRLNELEPTRPADTALVESIKELRSEAGWFHRQIDLEQSKGEKRSARRVDQLRNTSRATEQKLLRKLRQLQMADPELGTLQGSVSADLDALRAQLHPGTQLLEYFIARGIVYGCLIDSQRLIIRRLTHMSDPMANFRHLQTQLGKLASGSEPTPKLREFNQQATTTLLGRLHDDLIAPLRDEIDCRHLIVAPHGFLHSLPFHALRSDDRCLVDEFSVSYAPSSTVLYLCSVRQNERGSGSLVMGVPDRRAPLIEKETRAVAEILPDSKLLLHSEANHENLVRFGEHCRVLHIATHGLFQRDNPMFSAIRLGSSRLSVFDLYKLKLRADLVVLSGCSTGLSSVKGSDELVGLTRGLLYAGARNVLVSLWDVNDDSTSRFMTLFYQYASESPSLAKALRLAQRKLREENPHPYHWAPFILVGGIEMQEEP